jgi:peptidoglycan/xylan/chitin deacetylase (PgdA/CDA1 family)
MLTLPRHRRYGSSVIVQRPDFAWRENKRLAFYVALNIELFAFRKGIGSDFAFIKAPQTHRNYAWRDYGNRVGVWRIFRMFDMLGLPAAHNVNAWLYDACPQIFDRIRDRGDEIIGHGRTNSEHQRSYWEHDEAYLIGEATELIERHEHRRPTGWLGGGPESNVTPDLLKEQGYLYLMNWAADDQPIWMDTRAGKILAMPYPAEVNDAYAIAHRQQSAHEFADMIVDQFEQMLQQSQSGPPLVCGIALHTFIAGQPFRLRVIRTALQHCLNHPNRDAVWFTRPGEIARYCYSLPAGTLA